MNAIIKNFVRHPVAPNLAMVVMILAGIWATGQLTRQVMPTFQLNVIAIQVVWPGSSAEDVESSITQPLEDQLLGLDELRSVNSTSRDGLSQVNLEFPEGADMGRALDQVKDIVAQVRNLPVTAEKPTTSLLSRSEPVAKLVVSGADLEQLRPLVKTFERELRSRGLSRLEISGLPQEEISIELSAQRLGDLGLSLRDIAGRVRSASLDVPAGTIGERDVARQLRSLDQVRSVEGFDRLPILADEQGGFVRLGDVAEIARKQLPEQTNIFVDGRPAVEIAISRSEKEDSLRVAERLKAWVDQTEPNLPPNVNIDIYAEQWKTVDERIDLMVENALSGLALVLVVLFIFLNGRVAFWVSVGIPVSILAALMALYLFGGTINVMTLFALVMTFGIIVDDAIVVSEEAVTLYHQGLGPAAAAEQAAMRMFPAVTAASLTTVAAFLPLITLGGTTGTILFAIPLIVICVVIASLIECFIVLPGHLKHSLMGTAERPMPRYRRFIEVNFAKFKDGRFRSAVDWSVSNLGIVLSTAIAGFIMTIGLLGGGLVGFSFFPQPDGTTVTANARFVAGSPEERVQDFLSQAVDGLYAAEQASGEDIIRLVVVTSGRQSRGSTGSNVGQINVELTPPDSRSWSNAELIRAWRAKVSQIPGLESFLILNSRGGPPGSDIDIQMTGEDPGTLKSAALDLQETLSQFKGVSGVRDDTTFGKEQLIFELSPVGRAVGLNAQNLGEQLRANFDGELVQIFQDEGEEVEVRIRLAENERDNLSSLETLPILLPGKQTGILSNVAQLTYKRGFDALKHSDGLLAVRVTGDVDPQQNNANALRAQISRTLLPDLTARYGIAATFRGQAENQAETTGGLGLALPLAMILIYIILAWVFASYIWPLAVLSIIPFGLVGAIFGHWLLGFDVTMLSIFGFFGLSGIVINDSIILVTVFKELREQGMKAAEAAIESGCRRLRPVLLTSVTTVAGVLPLLFETSEDAQFLKPMVISIGFGLIFGTAIVLFVLPAFLVGIENANKKLTRVTSGLVTWVGSYKPGDIVYALNNRALTKTDPAFSKSADLSDADK
ncbi:MAG: efflux RND transporter permease subunit [Rhodospirillaceae bacterium]|nr:efflux RND transporter permease subunit [Rhodospirillaceae bacterium]